MSERKLKALNAGKKPQLRRSRLRSGRMSEGEEQHSQTEPNLESLLEQLQAENEQLKRQNEMAEEQLRELHGTAKEAAHLQELLEGAHSEAELECLRAVEDIRTEHQRVLRCEQDLADRERNSAIALAEEKAALEKELRSLRHELELCK